MPSDSLDDYKPEFQKVIDHLKDELKTLRTGRATTSLVEDIHVEAYGSRTALIGLASINIPDNRTITIEPWDKSIVKDIEKAIIEANIGLSPSVQGTLIRLSLPSLTEESRRNLTKVMNEKLEQARIGIRGVRETARNEILEAEKNNLVTEDDKYRLMELLEKTVHEWNDRIKAIGDEKETEIMTI